MGGRTDFSSWKVNHNKEMDNNTEYLYTVNTLMFAHETQNESIILEHIHNHSDSFL